MGAKFYRGADKPKKIRKRFTQTRTWFRQFKWLACKSPLSPEPVDSPLFNLTLRSRTSNWRSRTPIQGRWCEKHWHALAPRHEEIPDPDSILVHPTKPSRDCWCSSCSGLIPILRCLLLKLLRWIHLQDGWGQLPEDDDQLEEVLRDLIKPGIQPRAVMCLLHRWIQENGLQHPVKRTDLCCQCSIDKVNTWEGQSQWSVRSTLNKQKMRQLLATSFALFKAERKEDLQSETASFL